MSDGSARERIDALLNDDQYLARAARSVFRKFDRDGNGLITFEEYRLMFHTLESALGLEKAPDTVLWQMASKFNSDESGIKVTRSEFATLYKHMLIHAREQSETIRGPRIRKKLLVDRKFLKGGPGNSYSDLFQNISILGSGCFGEVHLAKDLSVQQYRCVKHIDKRRQNDQIPREQIKLEINVMRNMDHPNIVKIYEVYEDHNSMYIVMEYIDGPSLENLYEKQIRTGNKKFSEKDWARIFRQALEGLGYIHKKNIVHKDLKLANIMVTKDMDVKIIDFGLSEIFSNGAEGGTAAMAGTPLYMAPEVYESKGAIKSDVWSMGVVLYHVLTGKFPYHASSREELKRNVQTQLPNFEPLKQCSEAARRLVQRMLCKSVRDRPTVQDCLNADWIKSAPSDVIPIPPELSNQLTKFKDRSMIHSAVANVVAHQCSTTQQQVKDAMKYFRAIDVDGNGEVTHAELTVALQKHGWKKEDIDKLVQRLDVDDSGTITVSEFVASCMVYTERELSVLWATFQKLDRNSDGRISTGEFSRISNLTSKFGDTDAVNAIIREIDTNNDGFIEWSEFRAYMMGEAPQV